jgi:hypothetical protein
MARFNADLSMIASKAIVISVTFLNQSPEIRTSLLLVQSRRGTIPCRFPHADDSPATGARLRNSSRSSTAFVALCGGRPSFRLLQEVAWKGGSRIAVIHRRFYDLAGWKATLFPMPAKSRSAAVSRVEKAWLTFSGYQSLTA